MYRPDYKKVVRSPAQDSSKKNLSSNPDENNSVNLILRTSTILMNQDHDYEMEQQPFEEA